MTILPFLGSNRKKRKVMAQEVKEFSELVKDQYTFLMQQLEKVLKDATKSPEQVLFITGMFPSGKRASYAVDLTQE